MSVGAMKAAIAAKKIKDNESFAEEVRRSNSLKKPKPRPAYKPKKKKASNKNQSGLASGIKSLMGKLNLSGKPSKGAIAARDRFIGTPESRRKKRRKKRRLRAEREAAKQNPQITPIATPTPPEAGLPSIPRSREVTPEMRRAALQIFESQQGAGQVPYYMAAARNQFNPNMSPAFQYAAQNYDVLGGAQRLAPRPMEMMSVAERQQINRMAEGMANPPQIDPPQLGIPRVPTMPSPQQEYQQGMDMVMRGGGKGGPATGQQFMPPQGLAALLAQRFGGFGGQ
tara:strand:+ start:129 stop:977 length:849 start_codon:yes stop_codon:yes gene_type:complete